MPGTADAAFRCESCGSIHDPAAGVLGRGARVLVRALGRGPRTVTLGSDLAVIDITGDGRHFFMRGLVEIPVEGGREFGRGVWLTLSEANYRRAVEMYDRPERTQEPPYRGYLCTDLGAVYPATINLVGRLHTRPLGERPLIELERTDHPLAVEQRTGISIERLREIGRLVEHA